MNEQQKLNYNRIAEAITYIRNNFKEQPNLDEVAEKIHLSPFHFQRLFSDWAGTSPKKFLQYISVEHAKKLLTDQRATLSEAAFETGLSGTGRLHDLFISVEGMSPAEYKNGGKNLVIHYSFAATPFGDIIVASTEKGICFMAFNDDETEALNDLKHKFPNAQFQLKSDELQQHALSIFRNEWKEIAKIKLHLKGTDFQLKVWETLMKIPLGNLSTYGSIAEHIGKLGASRAVGTAIGSNPVAFLIPCHRVIQNTGNIGGYRWGTVRKTAIIGWENAKINIEETATKYNQQRMQLFENTIDQTKNWLPKDGTVNYYGKLFTATEADNHFNVLLQTIAWQNDEAVIFGKKIITKRKVAWYGEKPFKYTYSNITKHALPWTIELLELKTRIEKETGETFNSCLLNLYHSGEEGMAWHSDGEKDLKKDGAIGSLSFGAERKFAFKHKQTKEKVEFVLEHGSLLVMKDTTQTHWLHRLPPTKLVSKPRVNLTFRTISFD